MVDAWKRNRSTLTAKQSNQVALWDAEQRGIHCHKNAMRATSMNWKAIKRTGVGESVSGCCCYVGSSTNFGWYDILSVWGKKNVLSVCGWLIVPRRKLVLSFANTVRRSLGTPLDSRIARYWWRWAVNNCKTSCGFSNYLHKLANTKNSYFNCRTLPTW